MWLLSLLFTLILKDFTNNRKVTYGVVILVTNFSLIFLNTGTNNATFQQSGKPDSFRSTTKIY